MASDKAWNKIFKDYEIAKHNFDKGPFVLTAKEIKQSCQDFTKTTDKEPRCLCKHDTRESRPKVFVKNGLFILPKKNGIYYILKGEGYVDLPPITSPIVDYVSKLDYKLESSTIGDSEMQYIDFAYANSLIRTFMDDPSLVLTIRGRKYTPKFKFMVDHNQLEITSVQTEVDAGYEGRSSIVLIECKNIETNNIIIRQLFYPFRQWGTNIDKPVIPIVFEKKTINGENIYYIWQFKFNDKNDYNSIEFVKSARFRIIEN